MARGVPHRRGLRSAPVQPVVGGDGLVSTPFGQERLGPAEAHHTRTNEESALTTTLSVRGLSKSFNGNPALSGFNLDVEPGEIHAILGQNGSGKSTFIKLLSGFHLPDPGGKVAIAGNELVFGSPEHSYRLGCRFVHQDLGLVVSMSVLDNLCFTAGYPKRLGTIQKRKCEMSAREALDKVGMDLPIEAPVSTLTPAQRTELALARALSNDDNYPPRILVLDEPTATLPVDEVDRLLATISRLAVSHVSIVYVTHRLDEVFRIADRVSVLRDGNLVATSSVKETSLAELVQDLVGDTPDIENIPNTGALPAKIPDGNRDKVVPRAALQINDLNAGVLKEVSFSVAAGEIVGLAGITGSGRESILEVIFGGTAPDSGDIIVDGMRLKRGRPDLAITAGMAFLPGDRKVHSGIMQMSGKENLTLSTLHTFRSRLRLSGREEVKSASAWFDRLDVRPPMSFDLPLASFSGGNQQKILFAKWLNGNPSVFLLDEPTQGVDVGAKAILHKELVDAACRGTAIVISSTDLSELASLCDRVLVFRHGKVICELARDELSTHALTESILARSQEAGE